MMHLSCNHGNNNILSALLLYAFFIIMIVIPNHNVEADSAITEYDVPPLTEVNDLNIAMQSIINSMNNDGFFSEAWIKYYPTSLAIAVPNNCHADAVPVKINEADANLKAIVTNGALRIGVHRLTAGYPAIYSVINPSDGSNETSTKVAENMTTTTNLTVDTLDGYEIFCAREATKRLSSIYNTTIEPEFILISGSSIFDDLVSNLNNDTIDIFWSTIIPSYYRQKVVNFVCNSFLTEWVIGASAKVGSNPPDFSNLTQPPIPVACFGLPCTMQVPYPFELVKLNTTNIYASLQVLGNTSDPFEYDIVSFDNLDRYIDEQCQACTQVKMDKVNTTFRAPGTKFYTKTNGTSSSFHRHCPYVSSLLLLLLAYASIVSSSSLLLHLF